MKREWLFFVAGMLTVALPALAVFGAWRLGLFADRPDRLLVYRSQGDRQLRLHLFAPRGAFPGSPTLLLFHGGGWQYGSARDLYPQCRALADAGVGCISAEYRLGASDGTGPREALDDARAAYRYVLDNAPGLGVARARLFVGGGSAGGQLAAAIGMGAGLRPGAEDAPSPPAGMVLYNPVLDLSPGTPDHHRAGDAWRELSPIDNLVAAVPPALILAAAEDREVPLATLQRYCDKTEALGARCELAVYPGARHGFFHPSVEAGRYFRETNARVLAFLRTTIGG